MASVTLMEQELQHSMATSDDDAEFEEDDELDLHMHAENADSYAANNQLLNGVSRRHESEQEDEGDDGESDGEEGVEEEEEEESRESGSDEDAEGEDDDEAGVETAGTPDQGEDEEEESEEEEDGEGVGAVKIQPGLVEEDDDDASAQDDDDDDDESDASVEIPSKETSEVESEVEAEWEAVAEEDEEGETTNRNRCIFCQQDEEHDPSEDFEEYLSCAVCGDNSHRQCARDAGALKSDDDSEKWRCPGCVENALEPEIAMADASAALSVRRSSAPKLARDLLPSQRGAIKPDSHSVFNHLIVDDDPMDGSRLLRKRKTSSAEAEDRPVSPLRKRRKNPSDGSAHAIILESDVPEINKEKDLTHVDGAGDTKAEAVAPRPSRSLRLKTSAAPRVSIVQKAPEKLVLSLRIDSVELRHITSQMPKPKKKPRNRSINDARTSIAPPTYIPQSYSQPFYSFHDKENDELKSKPYGGILTETEADTSKTLPQPEDRRRFDDARQKAEEEWKRKTEAAQAEAENVKKPRKVSGPASQIECISFGGYEIDTWYAAPYPEEYSRNRVLHICEFCLKYMNSEYVAWRHKLKCQAKHPPGDEIYRDGSVSVFEVDGRKNPVYCQNLCLLAKLFLGSKTLYYDVEPFLFYVMTEYDELGCHFVGYFSKEKRPSSQNNVSCILTLPIHQRKGYGNLLIDFSYLLTRVEKKSGSPEKPLSDMGLVSYRNYWRLVLCYQLRDQKSPLSIIEMSERTGMTADDIVSALEGLRALVRDPITGTYALRLDYDFFQEYIQKWENKKYVKLNPKCLVWTPYIMGRNNAAMIEHGPPLNAIAPREGEEDEAKATDGPQNSLPNGNSQHNVNGMANSNEEHQGSKHDSMDIDELSLDSAEVGQTPKGKGKGKGKLLPTGLSTEVGDTSPSSTRLINEAMSGLPKTNGSTTHTPSALIIPVATIPPTRFELYPPVPGTRGLKISRPNAGVNRSVAHSHSALSASASTSRRRSSAGSSRRSTNSRPRSSTGRRRSGGTGRGPGRWPKGTKKSDFGNADSGPGLPPRMLKQRSRLGLEVTVGSGDDDGEEEDTKDGMSVDDEEEEEDEDAILYETPGPRRRRDRENGRGQGKGKLFGKGPGKGKGFVKVGEDNYGSVEEYELVTGDVDAEGEDE